MKLLSLIFHNETVTVINDMGSITVAILKRNFYVVLTTTLDRQPFIAVTFTLQCFVTLMSHLLKSLSSA